MRRVNNKLVSVGLAVTAVVLGLVWWQGQQGKETVAPEMTLERSKMMESEVDLEAPMSESQKQKIEAELESAAETAVLDDVSGGQATGTAWRKFSDNFYHQVETTGLPSLEKGFFYEGWLVGEAVFFSTGRVWLEGDLGVLYYTADEDKTDFESVVITLEPEDGDPGPADHVLEGSF